MSDIYYAVAHRDQAEIDSFKTRYDDFDKAVIPDIFKSKLNLTATNITPSSSWGSSHVIYFVKTKENADELVFRANLGFNKKPETVMLVEKLVTDQVLNLGIPTNKVLLVDISREEYPFDFQIQEKLVGNDLEDHFAGTKKDYDKMSYELGIMIAKLEDLKYEGFGRFDEEAAKNGVLKGTKSSFFEYLCVCLESDLDYLKSASVINSQELRNILEIFSNNEKFLQVNKGSLVHHDLADHNIMFEDNQITGLFDWEACVVGDPVLDLASCPTWKTHHQREEMLLAGYQSIRSLPDNFEIKMKIYRLRTVLWKMVYVIRAGLLNDERKQRFYDVLEEGKKLL